MPWKASDRHKLKALQMWNQWAQAGMPAQQETVCQAEGALSKHFADRVGRLLAVRCCA